jgi:hypothetical protein
MRCCVRFRPVIALPDNRKPPAGTGGVSESDQLAAGQDHCKADLAEVADDALQNFTALLLSAPPVDVARQLLADLPAHIPDPACRWWLLGVARAVDALVVPTPTTAADAAIRAGFEPPPALRGQVVSAGWAMVHQVGSIPLACAGSFLEIVREGEVRKAAERAVLAMGDRVWRGDLEQLAETFQREAGAVVALVAEVTDNG